MLRKMGWHDGSGLGREHQGIATPLVAENISGQGVIVQAKPVALPSSQAVQKTAERKAQVPTRTVCLLVSDPGRGSLIEINFQNLVSAVDIDESLEDEISDEAEKFGNLVSVKVDVSDESVRVLCEVSREFELETLVAV
eukprot:Gregarina_sp_Poly_1__2038@NODE_1535_length_3909_cov_331_545549_g1012_i0_p4_GENE_NODE_1535_length_3909_cov_331_545549_g1012_i0NODE_1535_length_3909_cov_331_545549_g1012_i0_p4_ORF_typecomplete_len139_score22_70Gpatch/PF01585_23/5_6e09Gpatch_2/PF12656_7/0_0051_NODE_1535_length_3909_cov_331_545549_g1012_i032423658